MLFSQMESEVRDDETMSLMNVGQRCGHSCFRICSGLSARGAGSHQPTAARTCTSVTSSLLMYVFCVRSAASSDETLMIVSTMKLRMPCCWSTGSTFQRVVMSLSRICSAMYCRQRPSAQHVAGEEHHHVDCVRCASRAPA